jgi:nicotinamidase-related amidase
MENTALLVVDVQKAFDDPFWGERNNPDAESNISLLISEWRKHAQPVIHIQHCSVEPNSTLRPGHAGNEFKTEALPLPGEKLFRKSVNSAFIGTGLEKYLHEHHISSLVIVGLTTDHCVSTTTRMAANLGFKVTLVSDATATFDRHGHDGTHYSAEQMHEINLVSLNDEFCVVRATGDVVKEIA